MKVYVAMICDRHVDPEAVVFTTAEAAISHARGVAQEYARFEQDYQEEEIRGWLFYARYSVESDSVWVYETDLKETAA